MPALPIIPPADLPGRRDVLRLIGASAAAAMLPGCHKPSAVTWRFFTPDEVTAMSALADAILPPDSAPGGAALGAVVYIDRFLSAFDTTPPAILAGGPYSNRNPYPAADGSPTTQFPPDDFATWLPLDRVAEAHWRLYLYGSDAVGGGPNDAVLGKVIGLRDQIRDGLAAVTAAAKVPLGQQNAGYLAATLAGLDDTFRNTLVDLVAQGALAVPEYGGNLNRAGWTFCHYEGDVQPYGFTQYDAVTGTMRERAGAPTSTANTGPDPDPMTSDTETLIGVAIFALGGQTFK